MSAYSQMFSCYSCSSLFKKNSNCFVQTRKRQTFGFDLLSHLNVDYNVHLDFWFLLKHDREINLPRSHSHIRHSMSYASQSLSEKCYGCVSVKSQPKQRSNPQKWNRECFTWHGCQCYTAWIYSLERNQPFCVFYMTTSGAAFLNSDSRGVLECTSVIC